MDAFAGEPFIFSTYGPTTKPPKGFKNRRFASSLFASYHGAGGTCEGYVTVAAQGDGVHALDVRRTDTFEAGYVSDIPQLSTLHPIISHTLGSTTSFSFSCAAVTRTELQGADRIFSTYAAVSSSSDLSEDDLNRTMWMWRESSSSSIADRAAQKKKAVTVRLAAQKF